jgi:hypothetical protein
LTWLDAEKFTQCHPERSEGSAFLKLSGKKAFLLAAALT